MGASGSSHHQFHSGGRYRLPVPGRVLVHDPMSRRLYPIDTDGSYESIISALTAYFLRKEMYKPFVVLMDGEKIKPGDVFEFDEPTMSGLEIKWVHM